MTSLVLGTALADEAPADTELLVWDVEPDSAQDWLAVGDAAGDIGVVLPQRYAEEPEVGMPSSAQLNARST
ncbi:MAG TPA: hypothetical protein GXZ45_08715 [Propionibacterium sp.]|nr:hypothetical protein [Propionibacterium sp.]